MALSALANYLPMLAFGLTPPFQAAVVLFVVRRWSCRHRCLCRLGVFNYLTVLTLSQYGVERFLSNGSGTTRATRR